MGNRKFQVGEQVIVIDTKNKHRGAVGVIKGYDQFVSTYRVKFPGIGSELGFRAVQLDSQTGTVVIDRDPQIGDMVSVPVDADTHGLSSSPTAEKVKGVIEQTNTDAVTGLTLYLVVVDTTTPEAIRAGVGIGWGNAFDGTDFRQWWYQKEAILVLEDRVGGKKKVGTVDFDSVIIADHKRQQILEALEQINQQDLIFNVWGFASTMEKGKGVGMLFYGPPGTGKTLMAQAVAEKMGCKLKIITTAEIESSEPGQAERNIRAVFDAAKKDGKTVLLFDECDALIFDRAGLGAILSAQVNVLLGSLENYDGVTIFTTNRVETLDEAVDRRLALKLEFEMPDTGQRTEIWKRMFPKECPVDADVDFSRLAQVEMAGGHIKNSVLRAARIAAMGDMPNAEKKIHMRHLVRALSEEGTAMLAFQKAKQNYHVASPRGYGGAHMGASNSISMDKVSEMVENLGDAYDQD